MKSVLICDNDPFIRTSLMKKLAGLGFEAIHECNNGNDCLHMALDKIPDLLIMEIKLPGKDGITTATEVRQKLKTPIIFHASWDNNEFLRRAMKVGAAAFLSKPLREQDLRPAVELAFAHNNEIEHLKEQLEDLKETLESRKVVERAKGVLIEKEGLTEPTAFRRMQKLAMEKRKSMREIAEAILLTR